MISTESYSILDISDSRWVEFLLSHCDCSIFHHPEWARLMADCYGYRPFILAILKANGKIAAGLPVMEIQSLISGKRWVSLPFSDHCQPLFHNEEFLMLLTDCIACLARKEGISRVELRGRFPEHPFFRRSSDHVIHGIRLQPDFSKNLKQFHAMHRRNVKIAQANDVQLVWGNSETDIREFYHLHLLTRRKHGIPIQPWRFFERLSKRILDRNLGFLLLAYKEGGCIAGAIFLKGQEILTYKYGASLNEGLKYRPNNLVMYTAIQWGCEHGFTKFDLGRSSIDDEGLRLFKNRWGAEEAPLYYHHSSSSSRFTVNNHRRWTNMMRKVLQNSPLWICRLTGELFYRHFG